MATTGYTAGCIRFVNLEVPRVSKIIRFVRRVVAAIRAAIHAFKYGA